MRRLSVHRAAEQDWTLDQMGNWTTLVEKASGTTTLDQDRTASSANEITGITANVGADWLDPAYDAQGNVTQEPQSGAESSTDGTEHRYTFDAWNRIVKVEKRVYSGGTPGSWSDATTAEYDGLNRRIVKVDVAAAPDITYDYYYNTEWQVLEVRKDADTDPLEQNTWHPYYIDALAMRTYDADTDGVLAENNDGDHYYTHDAKFNVTAVISASGTVLERYHYTPYGGIQFLDATFGGIPASTIGSSHTYTGREMDSETMVYHFRNRDYSCHLGLFLSRDPIEYSGSGANLYRYVGSRPTIGLDPSGLLYKELEPICRQAVERGTATASWCARMTGVGICIRVIFEPTEMGDAEWRPPRPRNRRPGKSYFCECYCQDFTRIGRPWRHFGCIPRVDCYRIGCLCNGEQNFLMDNYFNLQFDKMVRSGR